jgi:hypothetical protein
VGEEPDHTSARKPCPLSIISLLWCDPSEESPQKNKEIPIAKNKVQNYSSIVIFVFSEKNNYFQKYSDLPRVKRSQGKARKHFII